MDIKFQLCSIVILVLLLIFYKSHQTLHLYREKVFYNTLCCVIVSLCLDILSLYVIQYKNYLPHIVFEIFCKSYVFSLICVTCYALIYILIDITSEKQHQQLTLKLMALTLLEGVAVYSLPIQLYNQNNITYTYGPSVFIVYFFASINIIATLLVTQIFSKKINPRRRFATNLWMIIWLLSALIQFFNKGLLVVGFASALGMLILFTVMENPEAYIDRRLNCFNSYALTEYLNELFKKNAHFAILEITEINHQILDKLGIGINEAIHRLNKNLSCHVLIFKNMSQGLILVSENQDELEKIGQQIIQLFSHNDVFHKEVMLLMIQDVYEFSDIKDLYQFLSYGHVNFHKQAGDLIYVDENIIKKYKEKRVIKEEITSAIVDDRIEVFLQPIYSIKDKRFISAEALVRLRKEDGQFLSPAIFIPVAEETRQIIELGEIIFKKTCEFIQNSHIMSYGLEYIEINLSVVQCQKRDLAKQFIHIAKTYDLDPCYINLEITETASISSWDILLDNMNTLIDYGFSFSLDDFGKGESNLMYLVDLPVSTVKIDYDLSKAFFQVPKAKYVVEAIVKMAHQLNLGVVAEGIETKEEVQGIIQSGADYIQGYYYAKPLPANKFLTFIKDKNSHVVSSFL